MDEVVLEEMLVARDVRAARQQALLKKYHKSLLCFTMNIPGPVKVTLLVQSGFSLGCYRIEHALARLKYHVLKKEENCKKTGLEAYYVIDGPALEVKKAMAELEEQDALGRIFDLDVLKPGGEKVARQELGLSGRRCLLCTKPAQECARSRAHTVLALNKHVEQVLETALLDYAAECAQKALRAEVDATPKPGLVDRDNSGAHKDMDHGTFVKSIDAIVPYLRQMAQKGLNWEGNGEELFKAIRPIGSAAEKAMFKATNNINTHKGIIFSLGVLITYSMWYYREHGDIKADEILLLCGQETKGILVKDFAHIDKYHPHTHGEKLFVKYGCRGIRGEVMDGFPAIRLVGLPVLQRLKKQNTDTEKVYIQTLLTLLEKVEDTNILIRTDNEMLQYAKNEAGRVLKLGGAFTEEGMQAIWQMNKDFVAKNMSPGGTADLLIGTIFLQLLAEGLKKE